MSQLRMAISLDCDDPGPLSTFWAELLGGSITVTAKNHTVVTVDRMLLLVAMRVENYVRPTWPEGPSSEPSPSVPCGRNPNLPPSIFSFCSIQRVIHSAFPPRSRSEPIYVTRR
jgi:hypothetical protein